MFKKNSKNLIVLFASVLIVQTGFFGVAFASTTNGTIDITYKYAWGNSSGWINFGAINGNIHITDSALTGYAWSDNYGWINLNPTTSGVTNTSAGVLSGYAWGEQLGWINFSGVTISSAGQFTGTASSDNGGTISFDCSNCVVRTDWRPASSRVIAGGGTPGGITSFSTVPSVSVVSSVVSSIDQKDITVNIQQLLNQTASLGGLIRDFIMPEVETKNIIEKKIIIPVAEIIKQEVEIFEQKFPDLKQSLEELKNMGQGVSLPGITEAAIGRFTQQQVEGQVEPIVKMSLEEKARIPTDVIFVKTGRELIDLKSNLFVDKQGALKQKIVTISSKPIKLIIKPGQSVKSVKGRIIFKLKEQQKAQPTSVLFLANIAHAEELNSFEYTDPDGDGIYVANIVAPTADGEYEIITEINYQDSNIASKKVNLSVIVDPEGYVYEMRGGQEVRVSGVVVSLHWLNKEDNKYELWPAEKYQQNNPQVTAQSGEYSFVVPSGDYYITAERSGYLPYKGQSFHISEASGINFNIELKTKYEWSQIADWRTLLLIIAILLLVYDYWRDKMRAKIL